MFNIFKKRNDQERQMEHLRRRIEVLENEVFDSKRASGSAEPILTLKGRVNEIEESLSGRACRKDFKYVLLIGALLRHFNLDYRMTLVPDENWKAPEPPFREELELYRRKK